MTNSSLSSLSLSLSLSGMSFYPFIVSYPSSCEIINATTDDPQRPYVLFKFAITKTAEKTPESEVEEIDTPNRADPKSYQPFDEKGLFDNYDLSWMNEYRKKHFGFSPLPPLGYDMSRRVVFHEEKDKELSEVKKKRLHGRLSRLRG